jgi:glutathione synthase/RimK-type ligase-like ATP-grasp enzyme
VTAGPRVALLTTAEFAHLDEDLPLLSAALDAAGVASENVDWHEDGFDWSDIALAVIRSTWDYTTQLDAFLDRLAVIGAETTLLNPLPVVRANADKRYLTALAAAGVPVVPTEVLEPGDEIRLPDGMPFVVKPTVSAGARDTERYVPGQLDQARAHAGDLLAAGRSVLVQRYVEGIDEAGETGMVFVGNAFSHAFRKGPILGPGAAFVEGLYWEEDISPRTPSASETAAAELVLDAVGTVAPGHARTDLLYARVDLAPGPDGPVLMELELIEPSLFLHVSEGAAQRTAAAIVRRLQAAQ